MASPRLALLMIFLILPYLPTGNASSYVRVRIPIHRHHPTGWQGQRARAAAPTHVFTLPRACKRRPCQQRAAAELQAAGCIDIVVFGTLQMLKARCAAKAVSDKLRASRRFVDIAADQGMRVAAEDTFEKTAVLRFVEIRGRDGAVTRSARAVDSGKGFSFMQQKRAGACSRTRGKGVTVYVVDTGCRVSHVQLGGRAWAGAAPGSRFAGGEDDHGHGTHVAGTVAGRDFGVASEARVVCVKALSELNEGRLDDVVGGIELAVRMHRRRVREGGSRGGVVSISLGVRVDKGYSALDRAVDKAARAGLVCVVAAGNAGGDACEFTPARARRAITVAATGEGGRVAGFSNRGRCVDVGAPGVHVWSSTNGADDRYARSSGTSMAAPFVSGLVALILANEGGIGTAGVVRRLRWIGRQGRGASNALPVVSVDGYCRFERARRRRQLRKRRLERLLEIARDW